MTDKQTSFLNRQIAIRTRIKLGTNPISTIFCILNSKLHLKPSPHPNSPNGLCLWNSLAFASKKERKKERKKDLPHTSLCPKSYAVASSGKKPSTQLLSKIRTFHEL
jgi:hypothetical protein